MLPVLWRSKARQSLASINRYIAERNPEAAQNIKDLIEITAFQLSEHPYLYRLGRFPGTREVVVHPNYIIVYRVTASAIEIVNVLHARQQYP